MKGGNMTLATSSTYKQASFRPSQAQKLRKTRILVCESDRAMAELYHVKSPYPGMLMPYDKTHFALPQWYGRARKRRSAGDMSASTTLENTFVRIVPKSAIHEGPPAMSKKISRGIRKGLRCMADKFHYGKKRPALKCAVTYPPPEVLKAMANLKLYNLPRAESSKIVFSQKVSSETMSSEDNFDDVLEEQMSPAFDTYAVDWDGDWAEIASYTDEKVLRGLRGHTWSIV